MTVLLLSVEHGKDGPDPFFAWLAMTRALKAGRATALDDTSSAPTPRRKRAEQYRIVR